MSDKRVVFLSSKRFENLFNKKNFLTRNDAEYMNRAIQELNKCVDKEGLRAYLDNRMIRGSKKP